MTDELRRLYYLFIYELGHATVAVLLNYNNGNGVFYVARPEML
jgi:hypothetical protein